MTESTNPSPKAVAKTNLRWLEVNGKKLLGIRKDNQVVDAMPAERGNARATFAKYLGCKAAGTLITQDVPPGSAVTIEELDKLEIAQLMGVQAEFDVHQETCLDELIGEAWAKKQNISLSF